MATVQYELNSVTAIKVAYGRDQIVGIGIYLTVYDTHLCDYGQENSAEVRNVSHNFDCDAAGRYFDLHTGHNGFGMKVSLPTMVVFMRRYGVPKEHILELCGQVAVDMAANEF